MFDDSTDAMIDRMAGALRRPVPADPGLDARVMAAVRAEARAMRAPLPIRAVRDGWRWMREPRLVVMRPWQAALAAAAAVLAIVAGARLVGGGGGGSEPARMAASTAGVAAGPAAGSRVGAVVQFVLVAPSARTVSLVGDFNGWDAAATPLAAVAPGGLWTVAIPLRPGRHEYAFVVDGARWVADPAAPPALGDDFGAPSSVVTVGEHST